MTDVVVLIGLATGATIAKKIAVEGFIVRGVVDIVWNDIDREISVIYQSTSVLQVFIIGFEIRCFEIVLSMVQPITRASLL